MLGSSSTYPCPGRSRWVLIGALTLSPGAVLAEPLLQIPLSRDADLSRYDRNTVELGGGYSSRSSDRFGEYTGLVDKGAFPIANFNVGTSLEGATRYANARGWNLGLPSRQLEAVAGGQGRWFVGAGFQQIDRTQYDDTRFVHLGLGGDRLVLPQGFPGLSAGASQPPANINTINAYLRGFDIKQERDIWRLGGGVRLSPQVELLLNYRQDDRDGARLVGAVMGNTAGNPRAALLPYPLQDSTKQVEAMLRWEGQQGQANVSYWYSRYDNDVTSLSWQNPFAGIAGWGSGAPGFSGVGFPSGYGRLSLAPSNDYHQVQATAGWNASSRTRLTGTLSYGLSRQNDTFLPYTINGPAAPSAPAQTAGTSLAVPTALPASSLNGEIRNTTLDLGLSTRLLAQLNVRANYHYSDRDNRTPQNWFSYVGGDTSNQTPVPVGANPETLNSARVRYNLPVGTRENRFKIDADYQLARRTLLRGWFQTRAVDYEVEQLRSATRTNTAGVELRRYASEDWSGALRYVREQRSGSTFSNARPYIASYTSAYVATTPFDNLPTLRQYYVADYSQDGVRATTTWSPAGRVDLTATADWYQRRYEGPDCGGAADQAGSNLVLPAQCLGLQSAKGQSYTLDGSLALIEGVSAFAFYTYGQVQSEQASRSWGGANAANNLARNWGAELSTTSHTVGFGARYVPRAGSWDAGAQFVYNDGRTESTLSGPLVAVGTAPVPDVRARLASLQLFAKWRVSRHVAIRANYWYERLSTDDWAYDNAAPWTSNNVLLTGQQSDQYRAHVVGLSIAYENW